MWFVAGGPSAILHVSSWRGDWLIHLCCLHQIMLVWFHYLEHIIASSQQRDWWENWQVGKSADGVNIITFKYNLECYGNLYLVRLVCRVIIKIEYDTPVGYAAAKPILQAQVQYTPELQDCSMHQPFVGTHLPHHAHWTRSKREKVPLLSHLPWHYSTPCAGYLSSSYSGHNHQILAARALICQDQQLWDRPCTLRQVLDLAIAQDKLQFPVCYTLPLYLALCKDVLTLKLLQAWHPASCMDLSCLLAASLLLDTILSRAWNAAMPYPQQDYENNLNQSRTLLVDSGSVTFSCYFWQIAVPWQLPGHKGGGLLFFVSYTVLPR